MALPNFSNDREQNFVSQFLLDYDNLIKSLCLNFGISFNTARKLIKKLPNSQSVDRRSILKGIKKHDSINGVKKRGKPRKRYHENDSLDEAIWYGIKNFKRVSTTLLQRKTGLSYYVCKKAMEFVPKRYRAKP